MGDFVVDHRVDLNSAGISFPSRPLIKLFAASVAMPSRVSVVALPICGTMTQLRVIHVSSPYIQ